jgi:hypothetical protein
MPRREQMISKTYERRSINFDDATYKRAESLARTKALTLSAFLRVLVNETYERQQAGQIEGRTLTVL